LGFLGGAALAELAPGTMCRVPAGKFTMGERETVHEVYLDDFHIGKYPVTNAEYRKFTDATGQRMCRGTGKRRGLFPKVKRIIRSYGFPGTTQ
jgi:formylglycine-generating enzyme required for sulfatase activity